MDNKQTNLDIMQVEEAYRFTIFNVFFLGKIKIIFNFINLY